MWVGDDGASGTSDAGRAKREPSRIWSKSAERRCSTRRTVKYDGLSRPGPSRAEAAPVDPEFAHARAQRVRVDPEQSRRAVRAFDPAVRFAQRRLDVPADHDVERFDGDWRAAAAVEWSGGCDGRVLRPSAAVTLSDRPWPMSTARSITAAISRTLPGQRYSVNTRTSSSDTGTGRRPKRLAARSAKYSAKARMSLGRSRSGGMTMGNTREPVVEILAERLCFDHCRQVAVGGGDDPDVDAHGPFAADAHDLAVLDDAQQADLRGERELADFVEEERAAVGLLEPALPARGRAGEGALLVAEQLRVDQLGRDRAAVDAAERAGAKRRMLVDGAGDDLLAGAGLAEQEHGCRAPGHHLRPRHDRGQAGVAADQALVAGRSLAGDQVLWQRPGWRGDAGFL